MINEFCESQGLPTQNRSSIWASNASNEDADDNNSSSLCTQSRIDKWKAKHEAARFVVILVLVRGIRGRAAGSVLGTKAEAACRRRLMRHCRISHPGLIDLQCGRREQSQTYCYQLCHAGPSELGAQGEGALFPDLGRNRVKIYSFKMPWIIDNFPPNFQTFLLPFDTVTMV